MAVTRELLHSIPTQRSPQGSEPTQLEGMFIQLALRDSKAVAASEKEMKIQSFNHHIVLCVLVDDSVMINLTVDTICQDPSKWKR